ncbi:MAG TPA: allantoate amidohydrolase [Solirubrobacteraceae bacterium]|nr:allantoate amidohydrolase [Solirubrobacteraceae bacterium]
MAGAETSTTAPAALAAAVLDRADLLAECTEEPGRLTRRFATPALVAAGDLVLGWMREAGMTARRDAIGNVVGRWEPPGGAPAGTLLLGSHLDTVRDAGRYDGMLGVLVALACVQRARDAGVAPPFALEVLGFADEEGVRYGTAYLGSGAVAGALEAEALARRDADGIAMADAIAAAGGDPDALHDARRAADDLLGYVEVHIEQGPVLEAEDLPVGVVTGIAGQTRAEVVFDGMAGHAGTVPMALRRDALAAAAEWIGAVEARGRAVAGLVATVGQIDVEPGAGNVIPARATLSLDVRHLEDAVRGAAVADLREHAVAIAAARGCKVAWTDVQATAAVACAPGLTRELEAAVAGAGLRVARLPSGAGHDAAVMSRLCDVAMLFVRCAGGVSHHPAEAVTADDVAAAIDVTGRLLHRLARAR